MNYDIIVNDYDIILHDNAFDVNNDMHYDMDFDITVLNYDIIVHIISVISYMILTMIGSMIS